MGDQHVADAERQLPLSGHEALAEFAAQGPALAQARVDEAVEQHGHIVVAPQHLGAGSLDEVEALLRLLAPVDEVAGVDEAVDAGDEAAVRERVADELRIAVRIGDHDRARHGL